MPNINPRPESNAKDFPVLLTATFLLIALGVSSAIAWALDTILTSALWAN